MTDKSAFSHDVIHQIQLKNKKERTEIMSSENVKLTHKILNMRKNKTNNTTLKSELAASLLQAAMLTSHMSAQVRPRCFYSDPAPC